MTDLLKKSSNWKKEAANILSDSGLEKVLKKFGEVEFSGAYAVDLMMSGDIDIYVLGKAFTKKKVLEIFNQIVNFCFFQGYLFYDWKHHKHPDFPSAYYIGLKTRVKNTKWKIDIWFLTRKDLQNIKYHDLGELKLNREQKLTILKFKQFRNEHFPKISSFLIYEAVLKHKIKTLLNFKKFIEASEDKS
jgi:hypothetical protein